MKIGRHLASGLAALALMSLLGACASLPKDYPKQASSALPPASDTDVGRAIEARRAGHADESGFHLLTQGTHALLSRVVLADRAQRTLDLQYYIFHDDATGRLIAQRLLAAADRGVRVRLLLDDLGLKEQLPTLRALDSHPNLEVRVFNPFAEHGGSVSRMAQFLGDARRLNRRMHNKLFIADNLVLVMGGRNIGDEYFSASGNVNFRDLDVISIGPLVSDASQSFDKYWNSDAVYPIAAVDSDENAAAELPKVREKLNADARTFAATDYAQAILAEFGDAPREAQVRDWAWGHAELVADVVQKADPNAKDLDLPVVPKLKAMLEGAQSEVLLISPYFIPGEHAIAFLTGIAGRGVPTKVLTNSLASNDVPAVHSGYAPVREPLLAGGLQIYELKPSPEEIAAEKKGKDQHEDKGSKVSGSTASGLALHAKAVVVDRRHVLIGSMNMDPRSKVLNTEVGALVDSPALAESIAAFFADASSPAHAYRVTLEPGREGSSEKELRWTTGEGAGAKSWTHEPDTSSGKRFRASFARILPIDGLL